MMREIYRWLRVLSSLVRMNCSSRTLICQTPSDEVEAFIFNAEPGSDPIAVQVSYSVDDESTLRRELRGLVLAQQELGIKELILITAKDPARDLVQDDARIKVVPFIRWACVELFDEISRDDFI